VSTYDDWFQFAFSDASGFIYLDSLKGDISSYMWPVKRAELIDQVEWTAAAGLYFTPLTYTDGRIAHNDDGTVTTGRRKENAKQGCVVFCDADTAPPDSFRLKPSAIVQSSPGRWQLYWKLDAAYPADDILEIAKKISIAHLNEGADISSSQGSKLMLVPGSRNAKVRDGVFVHKDLPVVTVEYTGVVYSMDTLAKAYADVSVERPRSVEYDSVEVPDLLEFLPIFDRLPEESMGGSQFSDLIFTEPWNMRGSRVGDRSAYRYRLLCELFRERLSAQEVLSVAWNAKSNKWKSDPRGIRGFWETEVLKAQAEINLEFQTGQTAQERELEDGVNLLDTEERDLAESDVNFIVSYQDWAANRLSRANLPYHRLNAWMLLSAAYGEHATIPDEDKNVPLNFFGMIVGESGTGKGEAKALWGEALEECLDGGWHKEGSANIGANASNNALTEALIERDGKVSVLNNDEAHGVLKIMAEQQWTAGGLELWTDLYDGQVPSMLRRGNKDVSGKHATTCFLVWMQGTFIGMTAAMNPDMFYSGFLGRFIWAVGEPPLQTRESMIRRHRKATTALRKIDPTVKQWAGDMSRNRARLKSMYGGERVPIEFTEEAEDRMAQANWDMFQAVQRRQNSALLVTAQRRMALSLDKAAALLAVHEGARAVTLRHAILAIQAAEEWFANLLQMADSIALSDWARDTEKVMQFIEDEGGIVSEVRINSEFRSIRNDIRSRLLDDLKGQARIRETRINGKQKAWEVPR